MKYLQFVLPTLLLVNCKPPPQQMQIYMTTHNIINSVKENNEQKFILLIGPNLSDITKNQAILDNDFNQIRSNYLQYIGNKEAKINITGKYDGAMRLIVEIPFYTKKDSSDLHDDVKLILLFGPPEYVPLNKVSDYYFEHNGLKY